MRPASRLAQSPTSTGGGDALFYVGESVLKALDAEDHRLLAEDATRGQVAYCPDCHEHVVYKKGPWVVAHFAHPPNRSCYFGVGESERHLQMKTQMRRLVGDLFVDYEVSITDSVRADLLLTDKIVVECQASALATDEWKRRQWIYEQAGHSVLWVWDWGRLTEGCAYVDYYQGIEVRIPAEIRFCHAASWGHLTSLDIGGGLRDCHLDRASERYSEWYSAGGEYHDSAHVPKTLRRVRHRPAGDRIVPFRGPEGNAVVACGRAPWWKKPS